MLGRAEKQVMESSTTPHSFREELEADARRAFLAACPLFTPMVVFWNSFDWVMQPSHAATFLGFRLACAIASALLFVVSWQRWTQRYLWVHLAWVMSVAWSIVPMMAMVDRDVLPYYVMGYSLTALGAATFCVVPLAEAAGVLVCMSVGMLPMVYAFRDDPQAVVGSGFFMGTLYMVVAFQVHQRLRVAQTGWHQRVALAEARDAALSADAAKGTFLARMSHELRTPLNAILGYSELLEEELPKADAQKGEDLGRIQRAGRHLLALIDDVLDLARVGDGSLPVRTCRFELADALAPARESLEPLVKAGGNALAWHVPSDLEVEADPLRVRQIVLNLGANAARFTDDGRIAVKAWAADGGVNIEVRDDGDGMTADQLQRAFQPFVQVHEARPEVGGIGLGLPLSRQLAEAMGGRLDARSAPGKGSTFTLWLPCSGGPTTRSRDLGPPTASASPSVMGPPATSLAP